jgi:hypothetical protein
MPVGEAFGIGDIFDFDFIGFFVDIGLGVLIFDMFVWLVLLPGVVADFIELVAGGVVGVPLEPLVVVGTLVVVVEGVVCAKAGSASAKTAAAVAAMAIGFFIMNFL